MNRIREHNFKYQVLVTPTFPTNSGYELLLGNWSDEHLRNYYILEFDNMGDAQVEAFKHPDIDWDKLVLLHKNSFYDLKKTIKSIIENHKFIIEYIPRILTPEELKQIIFSRVMYFGKRFTLNYHMNDIISFHIVNPFGKNLIELSRYFEANENLRIYRKFNNSGVIHLIGRNDIGTTYEISLWPTLVYQWAKWVDENPQIANENKKYAFIEAIKKQEQIDNGFEIR
jgi:hypothetical protein